MNPIVLSILIALVLDTAVGDPQWLYHPVRLIGRIANYAEKIFRGRIANQRAAGILAWLSVVLITLLSVGSLLLAANRVGTAVYVAFSSLCIYFSIAPRDLARHAVLAANALRSGNLNLARERAGRMVSRDVSTLSEAGVLRAVVESTAENLVDGVTAPLFFAVVFGPMGAIVYRAINTLDAMFGYKNETYREFGWFAAKADDLAGWIPARLTGPILCLSAPVGKGSIYRAFCMMKRDRKKHESPNGGITESAAAGALGIRLGGPGIYSRDEVIKPFLGDEGREPLVDDIGSTVRMMYGATVLTTVFSIIITLALKRLTEVEW